MLISIRLEVEDLFGGMYIKAKNRDNILLVSSIQQVAYDPPRIYCQGQVVVQWKDYDYALVEPKVAIKCEKDALKRLAYQILVGDPMALDAARDVLKC